MPDRARRPDVRPPRILMYWEAWEKMMAYVQACPLEINGYGRVEREGPDFIITDVLILEQTVTAGTADTSPADLHRLLYEMTRAGIDSTTLTMQWHSHVVGAAYCSDVDIATIDRHTGDYLISMVTNKRGELYCRLDVYEPFRMEFLDLPVDILMMPVPDDLYARVQDEIARKVTMPGGRRFSVLGSRLVPVEPEEQPKVRIAVPLDRIAEEATT